MGGVQTASAAEFTINNNVITGVKQADERLEIPKGVTEIGAAAFAGNQTIRTVFVEEGVTKIGKEAFKNCKKLDFVVLPKSIISIGKDAFKGCGEQKYGPTIYYAKGTSSKVIKWLQYNELQYWSYSATMEEMKKPELVHHPVLRVYPTAGSKRNEKGITYRVTKKTDTIREVEVAGLEKPNKKVVKIPNTITISGKKYKVTAIGKNAFKGNKKVKKIVLGKNIKTIKSSAFKNCKGVKSIIIQNKNCKYAGKKIWKNINAKVKLYVPKSGLAKQKKLLKKSGFANLENVKAK